MREIVAVDVADRVDAQRVNAHVEIAADRFDDVLAYRLVLGEQVDAVAGDAAVLHRMPGLPVAAHHEPFLMVPGGIEPRRVDTEEAVGIVARRRHLLAGARVGERLDALRVAGVPLAPPVGGHRIVDVVAVRPSVVAEVALVRAVVDPPLLAALRDVVLDRQMVDVDEAADTELAGVVDHHVLDDPDAPRVRLVDQVLIGDVGSLSRRGSMRVQS